MRAFWSLLSETFNEWMQDKAPRLGAPLAYYAAFSIAPLLLLLVAIVGFFFKGDIRCGKFRPKSPPSPAIMPPKRSQRSSVEQSRRRGASFKSAYGAAGSFLVLLAWMYYSAQILFFGGAFTCDP